MRRAFTVFRAATLVPQPRSFGGAFFGRRLLGIEIGGIAEFGGAACIMVLLTAELSAFGGLLEKPPSNHPAPLLNVGAWLVPGPHPDDLPGTGNKSGACGVSGTTESPDFATAARVDRGQGGTPPRSLLLDSLSRCFCFCFFDAMVQTPSNATWVQAERRRCGEGRAAWMPRERRQDMDVRSARAHGASPK
jgi:hypothetical protein